MSRDSDDTDRALRRSYTICGLTRFISLVIYHMAATVTRTVITPTTSLMILFFELAAAEGNMRIRSYIWG